ncbi:hypothetical protein OIZ63_004340 [Salmonella enterica]|nr:hypothetical protein [Salmonella enterica]
MKYSNKELAGDLHRRLLARYYHWLFEGLSHELERYGWTMCAYNIDNLELFRYFPPALEQKAALALLKAKSDYYYPNADQDEIYECIIEEMREGFGNRFLSEIRQVLQDMRLGFARSGIQVFQTDHPIEEAVIMDEDEMRDYLRNHLSRFRLMPYTI